MFNYKLIEEFLKERRQSNGGWAKITSEDILSLSDIIQELIEAKCESDPDGDYPIEFKIINRREYQPSRYLRIPYDHLAFDNNDNSKLNEIFENLLTYVSQKFSKVY